MNMYDFSVTHLANQQKEQGISVSEADIDMLNKRVGYKRSVVGMTICIILTSVCVVLGLIMKELFIFVFLGILLLICCGIRHDTIENKISVACYGTVVSKEIRHASVGGRNIPSIMPYEKTEAGEAKKHFGICSSDMSYFYCSVEINGTVYDNIPCYYNEFIKIGVGDKILVANNLSGEHVVFACE
ncbi:MAG: hypothetical protein K2J47_06030 [Ruminococcus sp.]|nr:hypothetical protein [Ruminococcus sp.]